MKKVFNLSLLMAALVMIGFASCKPNEPKNVGVTGVTVSPTTLQLKVGATSKITATVAPNNATNKKVTWASSNTKVATVDASGNVKAIAVGTADITVTTEDGKKPATCKVTVTESNTPPVKGKCDLFFFVYVGKTQDSKHLYQLLLVDQGMLKDGKIVKNGKGYSFLISSNEPTSDTDFTPKSGYGTYKASENADVMTWINSGEAGAFVRDIEDNKWVGQKTLFVSGDLVIEANKIAFKGEDDNGTKYDIVFEGSYKVKDGRRTPFDLEPKEKTTINMSYDKGSVTMGKVIKDSKVIFFQSEIKDSWLMLVAFFVGKDDTKLTPGIYNVTDNMQKNTIYKSTGVDNEGKLDPSFYAKIENQYVTQAYFFDNGTAAVTDNKIEFNVTSHFGSTLKLTYTGDMTPKQGAPAYLGLKVKETANRADLIKAIR